MLMKVLAKELAPQSIRVNTHAPDHGGYRHDPQRADLPAVPPRPGEPDRADFEEAARTLNKLPIAAVEPSDISNAVLYLVSDAGRYVTGITHVIDAGGQL